GAQPERSNVVEPQRVGRRDARLAAATPALVRVLVLPVEPDRGGASGQRRAGPRRRRGAIGGRERHRNEWRRSPGTSGEQPTGANVGERHAPVKQKALPAQ